MSATTQSRQGIKVLIAGSIMQLFLGIVYVWSVFVMPVSEAYDWDIAGVKLMSSFMLSLFVVGIIAGGKLMQMIGVQTVVLMGGLMLAGGMFASAFLTPETKQLMYVTYGVIGGFGTGAGYNAVISSAQKWFPRNRGFATGVSVSAFGFATVIFAPLIETLIARFGLSATFMILAGGFLTATLVLFRFISLPGESDPGCAASAALLAKRQYTLAETVKTRSFYLIALSMMFATAAYFVLNPVFKTFAFERGFSDSMGTVIVMLTGVANALGRLLAPVMSDKIGREQTVITITLTTTACALLLCFAQGPLFMAAILITVFCYGGLAGIYPVLTADYFGIKNVGANYGAVMVGFVLSALCFPMILGLIGNNTTKFITLAAIAGTAAVLVVMLAAGNGSQRQSQSL